MKKVWTICSGKGGVGKTTLATSLAIVNAAAGLNVVLVDADLGLRGADLLLDMQDRVVYDIADVAQGDCGLDEALCVDARYPTLSLLPSAQTKPSALSPKDFSRLAQTLARRFDMVIVDGPAGIGRGLKNIMEAGEECMLVATPDDVSLRAVEHVSQLFRQRGMDAPYLVINRMNDELVKKGLLPDAQTLSAYLDMPLLGVIPDSPLVYRAALAHRTAADIADRRMARALDELAMRMRGHSVPFRAARKRRFLLFQKKEASF